MSLSHALITDLYEFSMANGYFETLPRDTEAVFDVFYRTVPDNGSFVVSAGLEQVVEQLRGFHYTKEDIDYLKSLKLFSDEFISYLETMTFDCVVYAIPEGTPVFPRVPILTVKGPLIQCQLLETFVLNLINHQSLIATKSRRINLAAAGRSVMEFGARRAQGPDASVLGARAAVIGGCMSTSNVLSAAKYNIPVAGTMAHAWVQSYPTELEAFEKWAEVYPDNALLLVDTYDVLTSGVPNAIKVFKELRAKGHKKFGIRIDSGDIAKLSRKARKMMDDAGFPEATITASNALNENVIHSLLQEGAPLDSFGVGEQLITSSSSPVLSGVFKLAALKIGDGEWQPKIKLSNSKEKVTLPGEKKAYRLYHKGTKNAFADVIALADESLPEEFIGINMDPMMTETEANLKDFDAVLLTQVVVGPKAKSIETDTFKIQKHMFEKLAELPEETQRLLNPDRYPVYLTPALADLQAKMIKDHKLK